MIIYFKFHNFKDNLICVGVFSFLSLLSLITSIFELSDSSSISLGIYSDKLSVITDNFFKDDIRFGVAESVLGDSESSFNFWFDSSLGIGDFGMI